MGFNKVYNCLVDIFPQVDQRILKAVAIENSKDADAAVEVILTEILPALPVKTVAVVPSTLNSTDPLIQSDEEVKHARNEELSRGKQVSECGASSSSTEHTKSREVVVDSSVKIDAFEAESSVAPQMPVCTTFNAMSSTRKDESGYSECDELILLGKSKEPSTGGQDKIMGNPVGTDSKNGLSLLVDGVNGTSNHDFGGSDQPADLSGAQASGSMLQVDDVVHQSAGVASDSGILAEQVFSDEMENLDHSLDLVVDATRSSQICRIDILEEIIEDARNNKVPNFTNSSHLPWIYYHRRVLCQANCRKAFPLQRNTTRLPADGSTVRIVSLRHTHPARCISPPSPETIGLVFFLH